MPTDTEDNTETTEDVEENSESGGNGEKPAEVEEQFPGMLWKYFSQADYEATHNILDFKHLQRVLNERFGFVENWYRSAIIPAKSDILFHTLLFAREKGFSPEQTSALMGIIESVISFALTPFSDKSDGNVTDENEVDSAEESTQQLDKAKNLGLASLIETFEHLRCLLLQHSVIDHEDCVELFNIAEATSIAEFAKVHFFVAFEAYQALIYHTTDSIEVKGKVMIELPLPPEFHLNSAREVELDERSRSKYAMALALRKAAEPIACPLLDQVQQAAGLVVETSNEGIELSPELHEIARELAELEFGQFQQTSRVA